MGCNVHVRRFGRIRKYPQRYNPGFGAAQECKNDTVASKVYMIKYGDFNSNVDTDGILLLLDEWDAKYCMDTPSIVLMRSNYALKYQIHIIDTPIYMQALSGENT